jgi:hypothetical protein
VDPFDKHLDFVPAILAQLNSIEFCGSLIVVQNGHVDDNTQTW